MTELEKLVPHLNSRIAEGEVGRLQSEVTDLSTANTELLAKISRAEHEADHQAELEAEQRKRAQTAEAARDEAVRLMSEYARKCGEAEGRLKMSEKDGILEEWRERCLAAEDKATELTHALHQQQAVYHEALNKAAPELVELREENERLRELLSEIADNNAADWSVRRVARDALNPKN